MKRHPLLHHNGISYVMPFILITSCFMLWGFANDVTNPMVKAFSKIFRMSVTEGSLVQMAFYGGYFAMAFPAAVFIRRYSFKSGILMGLALYAIGALMFLPAKLTGNYYPFLAAYFILTCGLSFLETSCNPYILSMGPSDTATRRLNLAQAFNPIGSIMGMFVAMHFIQERLNPMNSTERALLSEREFEAMKESDLSVLIEPYLAIGIVIAIIWLAVFLMKMPQNDTDTSPINFTATLKRLLSLRRYREGVVAQFFYVGAQIMCWTFIIQYGTRIFMAQGMSEQTAEILSQKYNIAAMVVFCLSRFICTWLLQYWSPGTMLRTLAGAAVLLTAGVIWSQNISGIYYLVGISACMSLMFPTIYGIALEGIGEDAKLGAAGLIMSILGGSILPPIQAKIIDMEAIGGFPAINASFALPLICFLIIMVYGQRTRRIR